MSSETILVMAGGPGYVESSPEVVRKFQNNEDGQYEAEKLLSILKEYGNPILKFYIVYQ